MRRVGCVSVMRSREIHSFGVKKNQLIKNKSVGCIR